MALLHPATDMNVLLTAYRKRACAVVVLLLWTLTVATGIVNACVLDARQAQKANYVESLNTDTAAPLSVGSHAGVLGQHGDNSDGSGAPCLKVCDDSSQSLPKPQSGIDQNDLAQMPPPSAFWARAAQAVLVTDQVGRLPPPASVIPIRTHLGRLAL